MIVYWSVFFATILVTWFAEKSFKKDRMKLGYIFSAIAVLAISIFAGIRATSVGIDVEYYLIPYIDRVTWFSDAKEYFIGIPIEPFFALITYINGTFFKTPFFSLFVIELLIILPIYIILFKYRNKLSMTFSMTVYLLLLYNMSLCIMRQGISTALILLAFLDKDSKTIKKILLCIAAVLFHYSGIIFILLLLILKWIQGKKYKTLYKTFIILATIIVLIALPTILSIFANTVGSFALKYYATFISADTNTNNISWIETGLRTILILLPFLVSLKTNDKETQEIAYYALFGLVLSIAAVMATYLIRMSYFFNYFLVFSIPLSYRHVKKGGSRMIYVGIILISCIIYWSVIYFNWNYFGVFPYEIFTN